MGFYMKYSLHWGVPPFMEPPYLIWERLICQLVANNSLVLSSIVELRMMSGLLLLEVCTFFFCRRKPPDVGVALPGKPRVTAALEELKGQVAESMASAISEFVGKAGWMAEDGAGSNAPLITLWDCGKNKQQTIPRFSK